MTENFERAFVECLKEGIYPGPSNINERFRQDGQRINKLNGQYTKMRLELMYLFAVPYQRGPVYTIINYSGAEITGSLAGEIPEYPYLTEDDGFATTLTKPEMGSRKHEIQDPNEPWVLKRK